MAKRKKTRQQKQLADLRRQFNFSSLSSSNNIEVSKSSENKVNHPTISVNLENFKTVKQHATTVAMPNAYSYLIKDLRKTLILTGIIIALQFVLFFVLKNHVLILPGLSY